MLEEDSGVFADKIEHAKLTGQLIGPITGFPDIDDELCGALYPGLHVISGNTGTGKTAFCLQVACQCGFPALYVTCEMSSLELLRRIAARVTATPLHRFKHPKYSLPSAVMKSHIRTAVESAPNLVIADSTLTFWDESSIREHAKQMKEISDTEHILIVIDSLHSWASWLNCQEYDRLNLALRSLRGIASELQCPVLYISEQSKTANRENATGGDLGSSSPAGFRGIEYGAESVIGLRAEVEDYQENGKKRFRPKVDAFGRTPLTLTFHKNRNGAPHKPLDLLFDGALQKFTVNEDGM
jgi:replicative DNA helicase